MAKKIVSRNNLFRKIMWSDKREKFDLRFFDFLQPQRSVSQHPRYISGEYYSEKCQRLIQYESGLELAFFEQLEKAEQVRFYWEQPIQIPYKRGKRKNFYTPDVAIYLQSKEIVLVEVKDLSSMLDDRVQTKTETLLNFCHKKGFGLLMTDGKNTIDKIFKTKSNRKFENAILKAVSQRIIRKSECKDIMEQYNATQPQLLKAILKYNLRYRPFPFKLQLGNKDRVFHQVFYEKRTYDDIESERLTGLFDRINQYNTRGIQ